MGRMGGFDWLGDNWFVLLSAAGIAGGLLFNGVSLRTDARTRRVANLLTITANHRDVWTQLYKRPELRRVLETTDLRRQPVTREEELFVNLVVQHLNSVFYAMKDELLVPQEGLRRDVWWFFSHPIPSAVWNRLRVLQNEDFAAYVEACRNWK